MGRILNTVIKTCYRVIELDIQRIFSFADECSSFLVFFGPSCVVHTIYSNFCKYLHKDVRSTRLDSR